MAAVLHLPHASVERHAALNLCTAMGQDAAVSTYARFIINAVSRNGVRPALLAVAFSLLVTGGAAVAPCPPAIDLHSVRSSGGLAAAVGHIHCAVADHPHADDGLNFCPEEFATAVLPRSASTLAALAVVVGLAAAWMLRGFATRSTTRGPPATPAVVAPGRQLLIRFCIARR